jgi:peptidoglycan/xylan/chitin deacetylase (PgdA/CDA1 family)
MNETGMRVTFFPNGSLPSWANNLDALAPLIASGQAQLGNHTWTHGDQTKQSDAQIADDLMTNHNYFQSTFGVNLKPYYRPPFGRYDDRTRAAAASVGYTSCVMWYGSLADAGLISEHDLLVQAQTWLLPQHLVIGHANYPPVTNLFGALTDIMRERNLQPVTLDDLFTR